LLLLSWLLTPCPWSRRRNGHRRARAGAWWARGLFVPSKFGNVCSRHDAAGGGLVTSTCMSLRRHHGRARVRLLRGQVHDRRAALRCIEHHWRDGLHRRHADAVVRKATLGHGRRGGHGQVGLHASQPRGRVQRLNVGPENVQACPRARTPVYARLIIREPGRAWIRTVVPGLAPWECLRWASWPWERVRHQTRPQDKQHPHQNAQLRWAAPMSGVTSVTSVRPSGSARNVTSRRRISKPTASACRRQASP
jgi:hypothetical protein